MSNIDDYARTLREAANTLLTVDPNFRRLSPVVRAVLLGSLDEATREAARTRRLPPADELVRAVVRHASFVAMADRLEDDRAQTTRKLVALIRTHGGTR